MCDSTNSAPTRDDIEAARIRRDDAERELSQLLSRCAHHVNGDGESASCAVCSTSLGWRCPDAPDGVCHYFTESDGAVKLIDGSTVQPPADHDPEFETEDSCIFCGSPEERK